MARILVIDDDVNVLTTIKVTLKRRGHNVVLAECGHRGVAAIEAFAFDAVIVDIFMPGINGLETVNTIRQCAPRVPIIATSDYVFRGSSASLAPDFFRMALDLGAACCLRKPFRPWEIIKAIETSCFPLAKDVSQVPG